MQLTMATVAEHVAVQEDIAMTAVDDVASITHSIAGMRNLIMRWTHDALKDIATMRHNTAAWSDIVCTDAEGADVLPLATARHIAGTLFMHHHGNEFAINGKLKGIRVGSGTMGMSVQNRHQKPLHPLSHQHKEVEVRRGKRTSEAGVQLGSSVDSRAKTSYEVFTLHHLVTIGIFPNVNSISLNWVVNLAIPCCGKPN